MAEPLSTAELERRVANSLSALAVAYERIACDPEHADTAVFSAHYGYPMDHAGNTILVASKRPPRQFSANIVLGTMRLDVNKTVRRLMGGAKLSFASAEDTTAVTGMMIGGVTVFALPDDLPIHVDAAILDLDYVILGGGSRSSKIKVSPRVFELMDQVTVVEGLAMPAPAPGLSDG